VRGSRGLCLQKPPEFNIHEGFSPDESKACKAIQFSPDGTSLAWSNMSSIQISCLGADGSWHTSFTIPQTKVYALQWSPLGRVVATWEQYATTAGQEAKPNLHLWDAKTGEKLRSFFQRKFSNWCPMWNMDESICSRNMNNEVHFYCDGDYEHIKHKISRQKVADFSMSRNLGAVHVVTYVAGAKGAPSICRIYQYPNFEENQVIANKSFYQADTVDLHWNSTGTAVLILTQAEVDKTGGSYYGKQQLHYMSCKGDTSLVALTKEGPIYSVTWSPAGDKFAVVFGFMPAKASLFNQKAELVFDYGSGPKNLALFNAQSSILMVGGFGNLRGRIEMWDVATNALISTFDAPDSTDVKWNPDGQHILTTTCAPRLRQGNGYKIWHYTGALLHEKAFSGTDELWEADWQASPPGTWPSFNISKQGVQGITPSQPQVSKQVYRPPGARGTPSTFKLHDDDDHTTTNTSAAAGSGPKKEEALSKTALKNKKKREAAKKRKDEEEEAGGGGPDAGEQAPAAGGGGGSNGYQGAAGLLFDAEKEKKIRKIMDKIKAIEQLKIMQTEGKSLEKNQLEKLSKESELLAELDKLKLK